MTVLWDSKVTSQFFSVLGLALFSPFPPASVPLVTPHLIVFLGGRKKNGKKRADPKRKKSLLLTLYWSGSSAGLPRWHRKKRAGRRFSPSCGFERIGTTSWSQFPCLCWPRLSVSCQAQISHTVSGHTV